MSSEQNFDTRENQATCHVTGELYRVSHTDQAIGELGYVAKYGKKKCKEESAVATHVCPVSQMLKILYLGRVVTALHS
jgi:hypothetical protein